MNQNQNQNQSRSRSRSRSQNWSQNQNQTPQSRPVNPSHRPPTTHAVRQHATVGHFSHTRPQHHGYANAIGLALIAAAFLVSLTVVLSRTFEASDAQDGSRLKRVVLMHWQLEPGYREAMQKTMDQYNALPHVRAAGIEVEQLAVTERIYAQVLNVNLLSGTSADITEQGQSKLLGHDDIVAEFFDPLDDYAVRPNPYNAREHLPAGTPEALATTLENMPWKDTYLDGMNGGWRETLQSFYGAPSSYFGGIRLYYNQTILAEAKRLLVGQLETDAKASAQNGAADSFLTPLWLQEEDGQTTGYLHNDAAFGRWAATDAPPDTLGRFIVLCEALEEMARRNNDESLTPIAGSSYSYRFFSYQYIDAFTRAVAQPFDNDKTISLSPIETWLSYAAGKWSFQDPRVRDGYELVRRICSYFPAGFLGLDREQARRRFISSKACMIATGAWDAGGIFNVAEGTPLKPSDPAPTRGNVTEIDGVRYVDHRFEVLVSPFPMPGPGERWSDFAIDRISEAASNAGATYNISRRGTNKKWAVDFLQYLTSVKVNQEFNRKAGWIPCIVTTSATPKMRPFTPIFEGTRSGMALRTGRSGGLIDTIYLGQFKNYLAGDLTYSEFIDKVDKAVKQRRNGIDRTWFNEQRKQRDLAGNSERYILVDVARTLLGDPDAPQTTLAPPTGTPTGTPADTPATLSKTLPRIVQRSIKPMNGAPDRKLWREMFPDTPYPSF